MCVIAAADDATILARAAQEQRVILSADTDFGTLLTLRHEREPSVILIRGAVPRRPADQAALLLANLPSFESSLLQGAIVVIEPHRIRVPALPIVSPT
jgi:predicted nuclease of predicted toxin-antitoxin system